MDYPVWHIPLINKGLFIGVISVIHVFVAQFAVGGGIFLVWMEKKAHAAGSPELLAWLERHTHFFLLLTMVFGGLSGVGIWFIMGVSAPAATAMLAHNFVFIWAAEWTFFLSEIVSLLVYYYTYAKVRQGILPPSVHMRVGIIYAFAGFMSLFLINGIISFMLTPGGSLASGSLGQAFFNPTFWPSLAFRTALCLLLAGMFALLTASRISDEPLKRSVIRTSSLWICLPLLALLAAAFWYFTALPPDRQAAIARRTKDIHPFVRGFGLALPLVFLAGVLAFVRAEKLRRPLAFVVLALGLTLSGSYEWIRENGRRPFVIPGHMYSNDVAFALGKMADEKGIAAVSGWARLHRSEEKAGKREIASVGGDDTPHYGALLFTQQCGACHGVGGPRIDIIPRLERFTPAGIAAQLEGQGKLFDYMPPFFGNSADRAALIDHLNALREQAGR